MTNQHPRALLLLFYVAVLSITNIAPVSAEQEKTVAWPSMLKTVSIPLDKQKGYLETALVANERCFLGDMNAMMLDIEKAPDNAVFIMSVEDLSSSPSFRPTSVVLSDYHKGKGERGPIKLPVPKTSEVAVAGLFICLDLDDSRECGSTRIEPYKEIFELFAIDYDPSKNKETGTYRNFQAVKHYQPTERTYFFQPLVITPDEVIFPKDRISHGDFRNLEKLASYLKMDPTESYLTVNKAKGINTTLASMPLRHASLADVPNLLVLDLPVYSPEKCTK